MLLSAANVLDIIRSVIFLVTQTLHAGYKVLYMQVYLARCITLSAVLSWFQTGIGRGRQALSVPRLKKSVPYFYLCCSFTTSTCKILMLMAPDSCMNGAYS